MTLNTMCSAKLSELNNQLQILNEQNQQSINSIVQNEQKDLIINSVAAVVKNLNKKPFNEKKKVVLALIERIDTSYFDNEHIFDIKYRIDSMSNYLINSQLMIKRTKQNWIDKESIISSTMFLKRAV